jgi:hypothetical protein
MKLNKLVNFDKIWYVGKERLYQNILGEFHVGPHGFSTHPYTHSVHKVKT